MSARCAWHFEGRAATMYFSYQMAFRMNIICCKARRILPNTTWSRIISGMLTVFRKTIVQIWSLLAVVRTCITFLNKNLNNKIQL